MKQIAAVILTMLLLVPLHVQAAGDTQEKEYVTALAEAQTGMLLDGRNADLQVPAGTQTKLMTVYLAAEQLDPDAQITVPAAAERYPGATVWLRAGEKMTVRDLLKAVIIGNANDACMALAHAVSGSEQAFVDDMNAAAFTLNMRQTRFADCTGISAENVTDHSQTLPLQHRTRIRERRYNDCRRHHRPQNCRAKRLYPFAKTIFDSQYPARHYFQY